MAPRYLVSASQFGIVIYLSGAATGYFPSHALVFLAWIGIALAIAWKAVLVHGYFEVRRELAQARANPAATRVHHIKALEVILSGRRTLNISSPYLSFPWLSL